MTEIVTKYNLIHSRSMMNRIISLILVFLLLFGSKDGRPSLSDTSLLCFGSKDNIPEVEKYRNSSLDYLYALYPKSAYSILTSNFTNTIRKYWRQPTLRHKEDREIPGPRDERKSKGFFTTMLKVVPQIYIVYRLLMILIRSWIGHLESQKGYRSISGRLVLGEQIASGGNGMVVFEGEYDGRKAIVKRLVRNFFDVDYKRIENFKTADSHPNIVRLYGLEKDRDFVYLPLEICDYTLYDITELKNDSPFELWGPNGYPTPVLLELMKNIVAGLEHMHKLGIIHRDLKPHNVLIDIEKGQCKLSDMGISSRLGGNALSLGPHATGSSGWQAPEQIKHESQTLAMDLFSLGCVLFYFMTGGSHPFGAHFKDDTLHHSQRDTRVINNDFNLFLVKHESEAVDLFSALLNPSPKRRPKASKVLHHPLFWDSETRLSFLCETSDILEPLGDPAWVLKKIECKGWAVFHGRWDVKMEPAFISYMECKRGPYKYKTIRGLLRIIRNVKNHHGDIKDAKIKELLGSLPEGCDDYFRSKFPNLLMEVYNVMRRCPGLGSKLYREKYFGAKSISITEILCLNNLERLRLQFEQTTLKKIVVGPGLTKLTLDCK